MLVPITQQGQFGSHWNGIEKSSEAFACQREGISIHIASSIKESSLHNLFPY